MQYKDLIFKITSDNIQYNKVPDDTNTIKQSLQSKDILIGIMADKKNKLSTQMMDILKREVERTLTVLLHSPISGNFAFLPFERETLDMAIEAFPDKRIHYIATETEAEEENEYSDIKELKSKKLNITNIYKSKDKLLDFTKKINYLVTINYKLEPSLEATLKHNDIMVFPLDLIDLEAPSGQKEKLVKPDGAGWVYNSASGMWVKTWGNDGMASVQGW